MRSRWLIVAVSLPFVALLVYGLWRLGITTKPGGKPMEPSITKSEGEPISRDAMRDGRMSVLGKSQLLQLREAVMEQDGCEIPVLRLHHF